MTTQLREAPHTRKGEVSLNQRIRSDIERKILSGEWGPGHRLPIELELVAEYGCSRMTVNKVLSSLVEAGLIERRRRAGTFVRQPPSQSAVLQIPDIKAEILALGQDYRCEIASRARRRASAEDKAQLGLSGAATVLALRCRHLAGGAPFAYEERLIVLDMVPEAAEADFSAEPPGTWLIHHVPWHEAEHSITARAADDRIAALLEIPPGAACLVLNRRTWRSGHPLTAARVWYPGERQELVARFTPASSGQGI